MEGLEYGGMEGWRDGGTSLDSFHHELLAAHANVEAVSKFQPLREPGSWSGPASASASATAGEMLGVQVGPWGAILLCHQGHCTMSCIG